MKRQKDATTDTVLLITSFPDHESASHIGTQLLQTRLAACITLLPGATSLYHWQGKLEQSSEVAAWIKTTRSRVEELETTLKSLHPYDTPELLVLDVASGSEDYLRWVAESTGAAKS